MALNETFKRFFGFPTDEEEDYIEDSLYAEDDEFESRDTNSFRRNRYQRSTTDLYGRDEHISEEKKSSPVQMVLVKAKRFAEVERIAENLKQRRSVIVNFACMDSAQAQRTIDFLSGTTFAMSGSIQRVSSNTFIFAVGQVDLVGRIEEMKDKESYFSVVE
ncbi:MAG: cell division protein SepF [Clostridiales bacterium]